MKSLLLVVCVFLVMSSAAFAGDWFDLVPSVSDTVQLYSDSKDTTVYINFNKKDQSFIATLYMSYVFEYYNDNGGWSACNEQGVSNICRKVKFPQSSVNVPYKPVGITFSPKSDIDTNVFYRVRIKAENGPQSTNSVVYFRVSPATATSIFYKLKFAHGGANIARMMITYDTSIRTGSYFNNPYDPSGKWECILGKGTSLRKLIYCSSGQPLTFSIDKQNIFWVGDGYPTRLIKFGKIYTTEYNAQNSEYRASFTNYNTHYFAHLLDGTTFIGNYDGLFKISTGGELINFPENDTLLSHSWVYSITEYKDTLWVSSSRIKYDKYINLSIIKYYNNEATKLPTQLKDISFKFINEMIKLKNDRKGGLWGMVNYRKNSTRYASNNIVKYDGVNWNTFPVLDSLNTSFLGFPIEYVFDNHDKMWILTNKNVLFEFDGKEIGRVFKSSEYPELDKAEGNFMLIDSLNTIYFTSNYGTLYLFNPDGIPLPSIAVTAVEEEPIADAVTGVYPQPAREYVTFDLPSESEFNPTTIELLNSAGMNAMPAVTIGAQASGRYTLPTSELPSGLYFAVLHSGKMLMKKPVVVVR